MVIFGIILRNISSKYTPKRTKLHHFSKFSRRNLPSNTFAMHNMQCRDMHIYTSRKIICTSLLNPVMYAHFSLFGKNHDKKGPLFQFLKGPLQFIKITLHSMGYMGINCFAKTLLSWYLCLF